MIKRFLLVAAITLMPFVAQAAVTADENRSVVFVGDPDWMPFEANQDGHYVGMVADILTLIEQRSALHFTYLPTTSWEDSLKAIKQGNAQVISQSRDSNYEQGFVFSRSYYKNPIVIVMPEQERFLQSLYPIASKRIGILKSMPFYEKFRAKYPTIEFVDVKSALDGLAMLQHGKIDAYVDALAQTSYLLNKLGLDTLRIVGKTPYFTELGFGVTQQNLSLLNDLNRAIAALNDDEIAIIESKWIRSAVKSKRYPCLALGVGFSILLLIVILFYQLKLKQLRQAH